MLTPSADGRGKNSKTGWGQPWLGPRKSIIPSADGRGENSKTGWGQPHLLTAEKSCGGRLTPKYALCKLGPGRVSWLSSILGDQRVSISSLGNDAAWG